MSSWSASGDRRGRGRGSLGGERKAKGRVRRGLKKGGEEEEEEEKGEEGGGEGRRVSGSLSPEVEQFLRDMNSAAQSPPSEGDSRGEAEAGGGRRGKGKDKPFLLKTSASDTSHHKPKRTTRWNMAAHFGNYANVGERVSSSSDGYTINSGPAHSDKGKGSDKQSSATALVAPGSGGRQAEGSAPANQEGVQAEGEEVGRKERGEGGEEVGKEAAARRIQRWYRGQRSRRQVVEVQSLLRVKRQELDHSRNEEEKRRQREVCGWE